MTLHRFTYDAPVMGWQRTGKGFYTQAETRDLEAAIKNAAIVALGKLMLTGPVDLNVQSYFVPPASWPLKKQAQALNGLIYHTKKPDTDNIVKLLMDALNGVIWKDDAQVVRHTVRKHYASAPGYDVTITELHAENSGVRVPLSTAA